MGAIVVEFMQLPYFGNFSLSRRTVARLVAIIEQ
jgi:hypothetical protein